MKGKIGNEKVSPNSCILRLFEMSLYYGLTIYFQKKKLVLYPKKKKRFLCQVKKKKVKNVTLEVLPQR